MTRGCNAERTPSVVADPHSVKERSIDGQQRPHNAQPVNISLSLSINPSTWRIQHVASVAVAEPISEYHSGSRTSYVSVSPVHVHPLIAKLIIAVTRDPNLTNIRRPCLSSRTVAFFLLQLSSLFHPDCSILQVECECVGIAWKFWKTRMFESFFAEKLLMFQVLQCGGKEKRNQNGKVNLLVGEWNFSVGTASVSSVRVCRANFTDAAAGNWNPSRLPTAVHDPRRILLLHAAYTRYIVSRSALTLPIPAVPHPNMEILYIDARLQRGGGPREGEIRTDQLRIFTVAVYAQS